MKIIIPVLFLLYTVLMTAAVIWCWVQRRKPNAPEWWWDAMREGITPTMWNDATDRHRIIVAIKYRLRD